MISIFLILKRHLSVGFVLFLSVACIPDHAAANTLAAERFQWPHQNQANHWGKRYPIKVRGPATITIHWGMQPFDGQTYFNKVDPVFSHNFADAGMEYVRGEELFDGKRRESFKNASADALFRKVRVYQAWSTWKLPAGRQYEGLVSVSAPGKQTGSWTQHAADAWFEVRMGDALPVPKQPATANTTAIGQPAAGKADIAAPAGSYTLDASGYKGKLEISGSGSMPVVKIYYDVSGRWETMTDARFDPASGTLSFTRPWAGNPGFQKYTGRLSGSAISGTFTDNNHPAGKKFNWNASLR